MMDAGRPQRMSQVTEKIEILGKCVVELNEKVSILKERLSKVLVPSEPLDKRLKEPTVKATMCPLASTLKELFKETSNAASTIDDILERLEL